MPHEGLDSERDLNTEGHEGEEPVQEPLKHDGR
jgi:hypothetical protein